jgi:Putative endonuclease segE, GIY-YIG domain/NUMOD3 motif
MSTTIPFSYYLFHRPTQTHYYGIKYQKGCRPEDLWTTYFTSSSKVKSLINEYGLDSFDVKIRRTFTTGKEALLWEHKVLTRLDAANRPDWLNRHNGGNKFRAPKEHTIETRNRIREKMIGRKISDETKEKMSISSLRDRQRRREEGWQMPRDAVQRMIETNKTLKDKIYSKERNAKMSASKKGTKRHYLPDGSFIMVKATSMSN